MEWATVSAQTTMTWWNSWSLRLRLTILYIAMAAICEIALGAFLYYESQDFLIDNTALRLRAQAKPVIERRLANGDFGISSSAGVQSTADLTNGLASIAPELSRDLTSRDTTAVVLDRTGAYVADGRRLPEEPQSAPIDSNRVARALGGQNEITYITDVAGQRTLVLLIPLRLSPNEPEIMGVIQLNTPLGIIDAFLGSQRLVTSLGILLALTVGAAGILVLTHSALAPLRRMIATCRSIAGGDLSQRANLPNHRGEVGQLAHAFDDMVDRIEASFATQRRFTADAAHELRTPLTALEGSLEVLLRGAQDDPVAANRLTQGMYREVARLSRLTEQLLDMTRLNLPVTLHPQPVELRSLLDEFAQQARLLTGERTLLLECGGDVILPADPDALKQALFNLVDNAVQHTPDNGTIRLGWRLIPGSVAIWVTDDGEGIPADDLPHIFEPFYRGDRSRSRRRGGTGLGLAIVKTIAESHHGQVSVTSRPGEGACFTFTLPTVYQLPDTTARGAAPD